MCLQVIVSVHHNGRTKCRWRRWLRQADDVAYMLGRVLEEGPRGKVCYHGEERLCVGEVEHVCA